MAVIFSCSTDGSNPAALCRRGCCRTRLLIPPGWAAGDSGGVGGAAAFESSELFFVLSDGGCQGFERGAQVSDLASEA
jgi:hypothetical protein